MAGVVLQPDVVLDGYRLLRHIGSGGFGEVWLCRSEAIADYHALKFVHANRNGRLEKEIDAIARYRTSAAMVVSSNLVPILHVNRSEAGLYYVMPLADGPADIDPSDNTWLPHTLAHLIERKKASSSWFRPEEILAIMEPVLHGLQALAESGLVHRDIKPDNILFLHGRPCVADISLVRDDTESMSRCGTPGFITPSWYVGGSPDMYGAAATLYTLITGNAPDKIARDTFRWPPGGQQAMSDRDQAIWKNFHGVILRAAAEKIAERYPNFTTMARALRTAAGHPTPPRLPEDRECPPESRTFSPSPAEPPAVRSGGRIPTGKSRKPVVIALPILAVATLTAVGVYLDSRSWQKRQSPNPETGTPSLHHSPSHPASVLSERAIVTTGTPHHNPGAEPDRKHSSSLVKVGLPVELSFTPPSVDRSPRDNSKGNFVAEDCNLAINTLAWFTEDISPLSPTEKAMLRKHLTRIRLLVQDDMDLDCDAAAGWIEKAMSEIPLLRQSKNAELARLLVLYHGKEYDSPEIDSMVPKSSDLGTDELAYRVELMSRLRGTALPLLDKIIASAETDSVGLVRALVERARSKAAFASVQGAVKDARMALELSREHSVMRQWVEEEVDSLARSNARFSQAFNSGSEQ